MYEYISGYNVTIMLIITHFITELRDFVHLVAERHESRKSDKSVAIALDCPRDFHGHTKNTNINF